MSLDKMNYLERESAASPDIQKVLLDLAAPALPNIELSLNRMKHLLRLLGSPERRLPAVIHVAGTNGKGSVIAIMRAIYELAGYRVHSYTSPHLLRFNERIMLAGKEIKDAQLLQALPKLQRALKQQPVTFFEATTALAFLCFAKNPADVLLLETGLGGEYDATNVVPNKLMAAITPISYDHQDFLGEKITEIAGAKAGIMTQAQMAVSTTQAPEVLEVLKMQAAEAGIPLHMPDDSAPTLPLSLAGEHQQQNAALAVKVVSLLNDRLPVSDAVMARGLSQVSWPARLQQLQLGPLLEMNPEARIFLDGGHNVQAAGALREWLKAQPKPRVLCVGLRKTKDAAAFLEKLVHDVELAYVVNIEDCADGYDANALSSKISALKPIPVTVCETVSELAKTPICDEKATVLICGSLYLAGNVLKTHA